MGSGGLSLGDAGPSNQMKVTAVGALASAIVVGVGLTVLDWQGDINNAISV